MDQPPVKSGMAEELKALKENDTGPRPLNWQLSPKAVRTFILGSSKEIPIRAARAGSGRNILEMMLWWNAASLRWRETGADAGGRAGNGQNHAVGASLCGYQRRQHNTIPGTAGTTEDMIKYSWNYALLLAKGPVREALVPSPLYTGMEKGILTRFEEITRTPAEIQDSLISVLSDKLLNIPELGDEGFLFAAPGFNVIGTANTRDKGVNEMSSALKRRFNFETVQPGA